MRRGRGRMGARTRGTATGCSRTISTYPASSDVPRTTAFTLIAAPMMGFSSSASALVSQGAVDQERCRPSPRRASLPPDHRRRPICDVDHLGDLAVMMLAGNAALPLGDAVGLATRPARPDLTWLARTTPSFTTPKRLLDRAHRSATASLAGARLLHPLVGDRVAARRGNLLDGGRSR